jgi:hypothetical protein
MDDRARQYIIAKSKEDQLWKLLDEHTNDIARIAEMLPSGLNKMNADDKKVTAFAMCALASILFVRKYEQSHEEDGG